MKIFVSGLAFFLLGVFLITQNTTVHTGFNYARVLGDYIPLSVGFLIPLAFGILMLFAVKKSETLGWAVGFGIIAILVSLLAGLEIHFKTTSLYPLIIMFGLVAVGTVLMLRSVAMNNKRIRG